MRVASQSIDESRSASDREAFREAHRLLVAFGIAAAPATLLLGLMGIDFLEGDFGRAGTLVMLLAGGSSLVCLATSMVSRRLWAAGKPVGTVLAAVCWPPLLTLAALAAAMVAFAMEFSFQ
jgi:hypothetical protein